MHSIETFVATTLLPEVAGVVIAAIPGILVALVQHRLKTKHDEKRDRSRKREELIAWAYGVNHLVQRSQTATSHRHAIIAFMVSAPRIHAIAKLDFPVLQLAVNDLVNSIEEREIWVEACIGFDDPHGAHALAENDRWKKEIGSLTEKVEDAAQRLI